MDVNTSYDSDGDGHRDFQGLAERLEPLVDLGVTVIWLMPLYPTADVDDGYDITDFYSVEHELTLVRLRPVADDDRTTI